MAPVIIVVEAAGAKLVPTDAAKTMRSCHSPSGQHLNKMLLGTSNFIAFPQAGKDSILL